MYDYIKILISQSIAYRLILISFVFAVIIFIYSSNLVFALADNISANTLEGKIINSTTPSIGIYYSIKTFNKVSYVVPGSPADTAGIQGANKLLYDEGIIKKDGDVVLRIDNIPVSSRTHIADLINKKVNRENVTFTILRNGETKNIDVKLNVNTNTFVFKY